MFKFSSTGISNLVSYARVRLDNLSTNTYISPKEIPKYHLMEPHIVQSSARFRLLYFAIRMLVISVFAANTTNVAATVAQTSQEATKSDHSCFTNGSIFLDPFGFLIISPTIGAEIGFRQFSVIAYGRWLYVGVLAKSMFLKKDNAFGLSYSFGFKGRYYLRPGLIGPHLGFEVEFLNTRVEDKVLLVATNNSIFLPKIEGGYRFKIMRFYVDASAGIGYGIQTSKNVENINEGHHAQNFEAVDASAIYGSASLDVGILF
jgi:hypothetical protein